jgi:hypothetical protein
MQVEHWHNQMLRLKKGSHMLSTVKISSSGSCTKYFMTATEKTRRNQMRFSQQTQFKAHTKCMSDVTERQVQGELWSAPTVQTETILENQSIKNAMIKLRRLEYVSTAQFQITGLKLPQQGTKRHATNIQHCFIFSMVHTRKKIRSKK